MLFILFYLLCLAGFLWTDNYSFALMDMEIKLSLLVFPLVFLLSEKFDGRQVELILKSFITGCAAMALVCLIYALYRYLDTKYLISQGRGVYDYGVYYFLKERLSIWMHPSYRSMYFVLALSIIYFMKDLFSKRMLIFIIPLLITSVFLYSSKAAILSLLLLGAYMLFNIIFRKRKYLQAMIGLSVSVVLLFLVYKFVPQISERVNETIITLTTDVDVNKSDGSTASRVAVWKASLSLIPEYWILGTGTGDVKDVLLEKYRVDGMTHALEGKLNAHSQYLQVFVTLGLPGFLIFVSTLIFPLREAIRKKKTVYIAFLFLMLFNCVFESMLEIQAGVVYYAFFNSLFMFSKEP